MADPCTSGTLMADETEPNSGSDSDIESDSSMNTTTSHETSTSTIMSPLSEPVSLQSRLKSPLPSDLCRKGKTATNPASHGKRKSREMQQLSLRTFSLTKESAISKWAIEGQIR